MHFVRFNVAATLIKPSRQENVILAIYMSKEKENLPHQSLLISAVPGNVRPSV